MDVDKIKQGLKRHGYIVDDNTANVLRYAVLLKKPLLIEGPPGSGKTELAKTWSRFTGRELIRLQCYEGIDENKALYEWDYRKQLLYIQANGKGTSEWQATSTHIYSEDFILKRPLLKAIASETPPVLLIDEVDKSDDAFESFLLEMLSDWQISIPEIGTIRAGNIPSVLLTSNNSRDLSQALRRRCLYLYLDYPNEQRELEILKTHFPSLKEEPARQALTFIRKLRRERLKKHPSISEVIDWIRLLENEESVLSAEAIASSLNILLKHHEDCRTVMAKIDEENLLDGICDP